MLEGYKTLGAMLALGEFSVSELATFAGVGEPTVRTTLRRTADYVERIGTEPTGRRGGQRIRWRLRPEKREALRSQLRELEQLGVGPWLEEDEQPEGPVPAGILAAEDVLLRLGITVRPNERADLVKLAQAHLDAAQLAAPASQDNASASTGVTGRHRNFVQRLIDLEKTEQAALRDGVTNLAGVGQETVISLMLMAGKISDDRLINALKRRLQKSPFFVYEGPPWQHGAASGPLRVVGIEVLPYAMTAVLIDEHGKQLDKKPVKLEDMAFETVVSTASSLTAALLRSPPNTLADRSAAVGIQIGAPVDSASGTVLFYRKIPPKSTDGVPEDWWLEPRPLGQQLEDKTGLPVVVENDANAFATHELWFGVGRKVARFGLILIREGVGGSLVINKRLFDGPMEIGNFSVIPESTRTCDCGNRGCLETTGGIYGILEQVRDDTGESAGNIETAARLAEDPDTRGAEAAFERAGEANAKGISIIVNMASPDRMVLYAPSVMTNRSKFRAAQAFLKNAYKFQTFGHPAYRDRADLTVRPIEKYVGARGAALLALERQFGVTADIVHPVTESAQ